jgi:hypothetical protein
MNRYGVPVFPNKRKPKMITRLILLTIIAATILGCSDLVTEKYSTFDEATKAGAAARGWLPAFTPKTAMDITLINDLDTNHQWLKFRVPTSEISEMTKGMKAISIAEARQGGVRKPADVGAWPPELQKVMVATPRASYRFFRAAAAIRCMCIAVDSATGEVFGWTCECAS